MNRNGNTNCLFVCWGGGDGEKRNWNDLCEADGAKESDRDGDLDGDSVPYTHVI